MSSICQTEINKMKQVTIQELESWPASRQR